MLVGRRRGVLAGGLSIAIVLAGLLLPGAAAQPLERVGLTPTERNALRIVSVKGDGSEGAGLMVTVTFAGDIEKAIGRGHLKTAVVVMVLHPKVAELATADLATGGAGPIGTTLAKTRSTDFGVVRDGRQIRFFIGGPGAGNVGTIQVKTFAAAPSSTLARRLAGSIPAAEWEALEKAAATDEETVDNALAVVGGLDCASLSRAQAATEVALQKARERRQYLDRLNTYIDQQIVRAEKGAGNGAFFAAGLAHTTLAPIGLAQKLLTGKSPIEDWDSWNDVLRSLKLDKRLVQVYIDRNDALIDKLNELKGKIAGLKAAKCIGSNAPPPKTYDVGVKTSYMHNGDTSKVCIRVTTSPAQPDAGAQLRVTGPGVIKDGEQTKTLNASGQALADVPINVRGVYTVNATVTAHGETETASVTQDVKVADATCPPPA